MVGGKSVTRANSQAIAANALRGTVYVCIWWNMNRLACSLAVVVLSMVAGCNDASWMSGRAGSGVAASEGRKIDEIDAIVLDSAADVVVTVGGEPQLRIEADDNLLPIITAKVEGKTLTIAATENYSTRLGVKINVTCPSLRSVVLNGAGDITTNEVTGDELELTIHGSGNIWTAPSVRHLTAKIHGSGNVKAKGSADRLDATVTGSGNLDLEGIVAKSAAAAVSGAGNAMVHATDTLEADVSGSGNISYLGNPTVTQSVSGSGRISSLE